MVNPANSRVKVMLVDDHPVFRAGLRWTLEKDHRIQIVAEASNGRVALEMIAEANPDVALIDLAMPEMNGFDTIRRMRSDHKHIAVLAVSMHMDPQYVVEAVHAGANGYLLKTASSEEFTRAVVDVMAGQSPFSSMLQSVGNSALAERKNHGSAELDLISRREREVLQLLCEGATSRQIAQRLFISSKTVETHRQQLMAKLDLHSVAELTKYAIRRGLTPL